MNFKKALKPFKKKIIQKNNIFRTIKHVYPHLEELTHQEILDYYGLQSVKLLEEHVEKIKSIFHHGQNTYHKSLEALEAMDGCFCTNANNEFKDLYHTQKEANRSINLLYKNQRIKLKLYPCPYNCGWHLTKG